MNLALWGAEVDLISVYGTELQYGRISLTLVAPASLDVRQLTYAQAAHWQPFLDCHKRREMIWRIFLDMEAVK